MHFTQIASLVAAALAVPTFASPANVKRQSPPPGLPIVTGVSPGSIVAPSTGSTLTAGQSFPFEVAVPEWNHCHDPWTPVNMYVLAAQPTTADLNSTYGFTDYLAYLGGWVVYNFPDLPNMGPSPPPTLVAPELDESYNGQTVYLASIETIEGCPPDGYWEYVIDSVPVTYSS